MSTLFIGLDISDNHVTSALVRVEQGSNRQFSIERDTYFTRSFEVNVDTDPREIISIWIECIDDLLLDYANNYQDDDRILGISIGIPGPMDYQSGVCSIQSATFKKFFGLNLRLSLECGLKDLLDRWKQDYYTSARGLLTRCETTPNKFQQKTMRRMTITPPSTPYEPVILNVPIRTIEENLENQFSKTKFSDFCGVQEVEDSPLTDEQIRLSIPRTRRETYFHDIEHSPSRRSFSNNRFTPQLWTIIEQLPHVPISFYNDATSLALGEGSNANNQDYKRILALTLGTTFGSAFLDRRELIINRADVPPNGTLWNCPYDQNSIADDWFSTRGLINIYKKLRRHESPDDSSGTSSMTLSTDEPSGGEENLSMTSSLLTRRASNGDSNAIQAFRTFARLLGQFLIPYINTFRTELIIIAGDLAQAWYLLEDELSLTIKKFAQVRVYFTLSQGKSISLGAVEQQLFERRKTPFRQTDQYLLPVVKNIDTSKYDIYPTHQIPIGSIGVGHRTLNEKFFRLIEENEILLIDGFVGTYFDQYAQQFNDYYHRQMKEKNLSSSLLFYDSRTFLQTDSNSQREMFLQDSKSLFGRLPVDFDFSKDFLDGKKLDLLKANLSYPCVIIGPASSYVNDTSPLVYIDLPKNELYYRLNTETACSYLKPRRRFDWTEEDLTSLMYERKCLYYLDYPIFNQLKQNVLPRMNYFIDGQRPNCPTWMDGETFRQALAHLSNQPIRLRPWFESGSWGGQWLKSVCTNLSKHSKNYSCSYEMMPAENGLILSDVHQHLIEVSWDIFYGSQSNRILGNDLHCRLFHGANDFPIRFHFLDTIDGGSSSIQCNPSLSYIQTNFGEKFAQDETYYIIDTKQHWKDEYQHDQTSVSYIHLGFQANVHPDEFHQALISSQTNAQDLNVDKYIQRIPTNAHDFFLIPNQTIHASGPNQVLLEISSAPYIYTFKLYDWLRTGSDGRPCLLNIEHGMKNLKFDRHAKELHCQPISLRTEDKIYEEQHLPTDQLHYYDVHRLIIEGDENLQINRATENRFHLCMLVAGDAIEVEFYSKDDHQQKQIRQYNYIESFLIPASISEYRLRPIIQNKNSEKKSKQLILLVAFLKWDCEQLLE